MTLFSRLALFLFDQRNRNRVRTRRRRHGDLACRSAELLEDRALLSTFTVTSLDDSGEGTLRQALTDANAAEGADTIEFEIGLSGTINLTSGQLVVNDDVTISGPGANTLAVDAGGNHRVFLINSGKNAEISGLTISGGNSGTDAGGGIFNSGNLTLDAAVVTGNQAGTGGGGIFSQFGTTTIVRNSTISGNVAGTGAGGIAAAGGDLTVVNSTVSGNSATRSGGGLFLSGSANTLTVINSTITANRSDSDGSGGETGGGLFVNSGTSVLHNTILAGNVSGAPGSGSPDDLGGTLDASSSSNLIGGDPFLGPLQNNGGPTPTHALLPGSPAIDAGSSALAVDPATGAPLANDQRGSGFPRIQSDTVDIGAYEFLSSLSIDDVAVLEGDSGTTDAVFTVSLDHPSGVEVTVDYTTAAGTATAGSDFPATSGQLTFPPGETTQTITVPISGDLVFETDETFFINLSNPVAAQIADGQGQGTILNDDAPPQIIIDDVAVSEGDAGTTEATFTVSLVGSSELTTTVDFATADDTALAGSDYTAAGGTVTIDPGQTSATITVLVSGDTEVEPDETFFVHLSNPTNATIADGQGQGTILNDDVVTNSPPVAADDEYTTTEDGTLVVDAPGVLENDGDPDGDPLTVSLLTGPAHGALTLNPDGSFTYTPDADFHGTDGFEYEISDGNGGTATAMVEITVLSAEEQREALIGAIEDLVDDGSLNNGQGNSLIRKLTPNGNTRAVLNRLRAFTNHVNALVDGGVLTEEEGAELISAAEALKTSLETTAEAETLDRLFANPGRMADDLLTRGRGRGRGR